MGATPTGTLANTPLLSTSRAQRKPKPNWSFLGGSRLNAKPFVFTVKVTTSPDSRWIPGFVATSHFFSRNALFEKGYPVAL